MAVWLNSDKPASPAWPPAASKVRKKMPDIPILASYQKKPPENFWEQFPKFKPTRFVSGPVRVAVLRRLVQKCWFDWNQQQRADAKKALKILRSGAITELKRELGPLESKNAMSACLHGELLTDNIAHWVKTKVVAGPYRKAPLNGFRSNPLMAVAQKNKVRPILNLSAPKGGSFNDAVEEQHLKKLTMSTARGFGQTIRKLGAGAVMAKSDIVDAYKLIAGHNSQWQHFGFKWLGKYFFDVTTVFGSKSAPANFDCLPETLVNIVCTLTGFPNAWVHRQLDDVPLAAPAAGNMTENFVQKYAEVCRQVGVPLAANCPDREKAFAPGTDGIVLGIKFDSQKLTWALPADKLFSIKELTGKFRADRTCHLKAAQKLHGKLNDAAQMCEFLKGFRFHLIKLLVSFDGKEEEPRLIKAGLKADLLVWEKAVEAAAGGLPIPEIPTAPPITALNFISDAAGAAYRWEHGRCKNETKPGDRGAAAVGYKGDALFFAGGLKWPNRLVMTQKDASGRWFGGKSMALECVGLLIPLLGAPDLVRRHHVHLHVDNVGLVYAWEKRYCKNDEETSILIRCIHVLEAFLECKVYISHTKRRSTKWAALVDNLTRETTTRALDLEQIRHLTWKEPGGVLRDWLENPLPDWELPNRLLKELTPT